MAQRPTPGFDAMRQDAIRRSREMHRRAVPSPSPPSVPLETPEPPEVSLSFLQSLSIPAELTGLLTDWDTSSTRKAPTRLCFLLWGIFCCDMFCSFTPFGASQLAYCGHRRKDFT